MSWAIALIFGYVSSAFILSYIGFKLDKTHTAIKVLLLFVAFYLLILSVHTGTFIVAESGIDSTSITKMTNSLETIYKVMVWVIRILSAYVIFYFLYKILLSVKWRK